MTEGHERWHAERGAERAPKTEIVGGLPQLAQLGPFAYRITTDPIEWQVSKEDPERHYGYTDHQRGVVIIHEHASEAMRRVILLHELMHAAAFAAGQLDNRKRREEDWVAMVAPMLLDALQRSSELTTYLLTPPGRSPSGGDA